MCFLYLLFVGRGLCFLFVFVFFFGGLKRRIRNILAINHDFAIIRRRVVSCDVLPSLKICGIAWELRCLNESSVAHHQSEV
jgi:hypothetical protein